MGVSVNDGSDSLVADWQSEALAAQGGVTRVTVAGWPAEDTA